MRLTRLGVHGTVFYTALVAAYFGSPYSNSFFLMLGFLTLVGLGGVLGARRNLVGVSVASVELAPTPSGAAVRGMVELRAPQPMRFGVSVRIELAGHHARAAELALLGRVESLDGRASIALVAPPLPRGRYTVRCALLESVHPFGLVRVQRAFPAPSELFVYPRPAERALGRTLADMERELLGRDVADESEREPASLRDHQERDGSRGVHWRASARRGRLVVLEWESARGAGREVVLDRRCAPDALEAALVTLSSLVHLAREGQETLRLHTQGMSVTFGQGQRPWEDALCFLASAEVLPESGPAPPTVAPSVTRLPGALAGATSHAG